MRARTSLPWFALVFSVACDGQFSSPNGSPVPVERDARDSRDGTGVPDGAGASDATPSQDSNRAPPADTSAPRDTDRPGDAPSAPAACDPDYYACTASEDLEYCDGALQVADCGTVCRDAGFAFTTGCGYDEVYDGDVCWCDDAAETPPPPTCDAGACSDRCIAGGYEPGACTAAGCECGAPLPPAATCNTGWSCEGKTLAYCDGQGVERWSCDAFCRGQGYASASACGWDPSLADEACFCQDDACTGGADICLASDYLETCAGTRAVTVDCWDVCRDAGYDSVAGCGFDASSGGDACFCQNEVCLGGDLVCADGSCLDPAYVCDGVADCSSGDDEWGCAATCVDGDSWCVSGYELEVCDGGEPWVYDCDAFCRDEGFDFAEGCGYDASSGFDACYCAFEACASWEIQCDDGLCLDEVYACDGYFDCGHGEDEIGCY